MGVLTSQAAIRLLRMLDPETAHDLVLRVLSSGAAFRHWRTPAEPDDPSLAVDVLGLHFPNPIGLAAGFDKNATAAPALLRMGFGFVETGSVTPRPQPGNPKPRIFRLAEDQAVINRLGFNNAGLSAYVRHLAALRARQVPIGANLGINKDRADPARDYPALIQAVRPLVDYAVINVSSPNTPGLRDLQAEAHLRLILDAVVGVCDRLPVLVKVAPDLTLDGMAALVETCVQAGVQGLIVSNTTISRPPGLRSRHAAQAGGLSGRPLWSLSTAMLAHASLLAKGRLTLIGTGGVFSGADVLSKLQAGASLVQLYTAFVYYGPALIPRLKSELRAALRDSGLASVRDAIGTRAREWAASL